MQPLQRASRIGASGDLNRFAHQVLQTVAHAAHTIMAGQAQVIIAGGAESMSMVPMTGNKFAPNPYFASESPDVFTNMGLTAENVAAKYEVAGRTGSVATCSNRCASAAVSQPVRRGDRADRGQYRTGAGW
jgi:acetyl-CoA acetyltransferase